MFHGAFVRGDEGGEVAVGMGVGAGAVVVGHVEVAEVGADYDGGGGFVVVVVG